MTIHSSHHRSLYTLFSGIQDFSYVIAIPEQKYAIREKEGFSMKNKKKLLSVLLVFVMTVSVFHGYAAKAADTVKVTLRLEQDNKTLVTPVEVTLTDEDKKDYGIDLSTETLTPLHALAKYLTEKKGATTETMKNYIMASKSQYGLYVTGISIDGKSDGSASSDALDGVNWGYAVNNTDPGVGMGSYSLKNNDAVTIYGLWGGGTWPNNVETNYSYFENSTLNTTVSNKTTVSLKGVGYDENYNPIVKSISNATVVAAKYENEASTATTGNAVSLVRMKTVLLLFPLIKQVLMYSPLTVWTATANTPTFPDHTELLTCLLQLPHQQLLQPLHQQLLRPLHQQLLRQAILLANRFQQKLRLPHQLRHRMTRVLKKLQKNLLR